MFGQGYFQVDPNMTPEEIKARRKRLDSMAPDGGARYVGEGVADLIKGMVAGAGHRRLDKVMAAQRPKEGPLTVLGMRGEVPAYKRGTAFHPGGMALVGEEGPELVNLPRGAQVVPNPQTAAFRPGVDAANVYAEAARPDMAAMMPASQSRFLDDQAYQVAQAAGTTTDGYFGGPDIAATEGKSPDDRGAREIKRAIIGLGEGLDDYERILKEHGGGAVLPSAERDKIRSIRRAIQMQMKDLYGLGALQGPDMQLLEDIMAVDPTALGPNVADFFGVDVVDRVVQNNNLLRDHLADVAGARLRDYGIDVRDIMKMRRPTDGGGDTPPSGDGWTEINGVRVRVKQ